MGETGWEPGWGLYPAMLKWGAHKFMLVPVQRVAPQWRLSKENRWMRFCHKEYNRTIGRKGREQCREVHTISGVQVWKGEALRARVRAIVSSRRVDVSSASLLRLLLRLEVCSQKKMPHGFFTRWRES